MVVDGTALTGPSIGQYVPQRFGVVNFKLLLDLGNFKNLLDVGRHISE